MMDEKNYTSNMEVVTRYGVRAVIVRDGKIATERGMAGDFKILGGGIDGGEDLCEPSVEDRDEVVFRYSCFGDGFLREDEVLFYEFAENLFVLLEVVDK